MTTVQYQAVYPGMSFSLFGRPIDLSDTPSGLLLIVAVETGQMTPTSGKVFFSGETIPDDWQHVASTFTLDQGLVSVWVEPGIVEPPICEWCMHLVSQHGQNRCLALDGNAEPCACARGYKQ